MTKSIKYVARLDGVIVGKRTSKILDKTYTHAIVIEHPVRGRCVACWCSRPDLARDQQRQWSRNFSAHIVTAEVVQ